MSRSFNPKLSINERSYEMKLNIAIKFALSTALNEGLRGLFLRTVCRFSPGRTTRLADFVIRNRTADVSTFLAAEVRGLYVMDGLPAANTILDIGAYNGASAINFAKQFPSSHIHAFEPDEENFVICQKNCIAYDNITVHNVALMDKTKTYYIASTTDFSLGHKVEEVGDESGAVDGLAIDDFLKSHNISAVDIMKLNIEGAEIEIFDSLSQLHGVNVGSMIIDLHDRKRSGCFDALVKFCYAGHWNLEIREHFLVLINRSYMAQK